MPGLASPRADVPLKQVPRHQLQGYVTSKTTVMGLNKYFYAIMLMAAARASSSAQVKCGDMSVYARLKSKQHRVRDPDF